MENSKRKPSALMRSVILGCLFFILLICCGMLTVGYIIYNESLKGRYESYLQTVAPEMSEIQLETLRAQLQRAGVLELQRYMLTGIIVAAVMVVIFLICISLWIRSRLVDPLLAVEKSVVDYAARSHGDEMSDTLVYERPDINTGDEIEAIADAMVSLSEDMNSYVERLMMSRSEMRIMKRRVNKMDELAYKDALTGVNNKASFDRIKARLDWDIMNKKAQFALVMVDLNYLKKINDQYGHDAGDTYIKTTCEIISSVFEHSPVFRVGGDEFVVVLENNDYTEREKLMGELTDRIEAASKDASKDAGERVSAAVGIAIYNPSRDDDSDSVFRRADNTMYENKKAMKALRRE